MSSICEGDAQHVRLLDGTEMCARRLRPDDVDAVLELHQRLTEQEQYLRFFVTHPTYLDTFARKVVECNDTQSAVGAFEAGRLIGVANYVVSRDPGVAEMAVAVAHEDHLRGVATALLKRLGQIASDNGIHSFTADILVTNTAMLKVISDAGWRHTSYLDGSVLNVTIDLADMHNPYARGAVNAV